MNDIDIPIKIQDLTKHNVTEVNKSKYVVPRMKNFRDFVYIR